MATGSIYTIIILIVAATALLLISLRGWGDTIYMLVKNWRITSFFLVCAIIGAFIATHTDDISSMMQGRLKVNHDKAEVTINNCRNFLTAYTSNEDGILKEPVKVGFIKISNDTSDYWKSHYFEVCAQAFGLNYWRHDINVNGRSGGVVLCEAYEKENFRSGKIESWCSTVFAQEPKT